MLPTTIAEKKRVRKSFGVLKRPLQLPYLLGEQKKSYNAFLASDENLDTGVDHVLQSIFPIQSATGNASLEYRGYYLVAGDFSPQECLVRGEDYSTALRAKIMLVLRDKDSSGEFSIVKDRKMQDVFLGDIPLITDSGSFIINGTERVVVSQLHRSPGVFFDHDRGRTHSSGKILFSARIIPYRGSWLDFEFDHKDNVYVRIDRRRKLPATLLLRALKYSNQEMLDIFFERDVYTYKKKAFYLKFIPDHMLGKLAFSDMHDGDGKLIVARGKRINQLHIKKLQAAGVKELLTPEETLLGQALAVDLVDKSTGEILAPANSEVTEELLTAVRERGLKKFEVLFTNEINRGPYLSQTLRLDHTTSELEALLEIYRVIRPGEPPNQESAEAVFDALFFNKQRYTLSRVGRMKLNRRLGITKREKDMVLSREDIVEVLKTLIAIRNGQDQIDDIDHLGNRRVRSVGEMVENQMRIGLLRIERAVRDRLTYAETEELMPQDLINAKPVTAAIKEFFSSSQLSQFMDQCNPLSEITHKRRISALGPGGLTRDRAGFEVRDVHPTHYGRVCPIETPEGPNIGLINSLSSYARTNEYGFIETPFRMVQDGRVLDQITHLSAIDEIGQTIAEAGIELDADNRIVADMVPSRRADEVALRPVSEITLMDVAPEQMVSVAAAMIPFLEHDDANRALMGSNMQRQAVPLSMSEKPLVGTGVERQVALDSGVCVRASRPGVVESIDSQRIIVRNSDSSTEESPIQVYPLVKYQRTNQNTCLNQTPIVEVGDQVQEGEIIADGSCCDLGELALGKNVRIAFMPWNGYNFEDSIIISERIVKEETFMSMHIQEFTCIARNTKLGDEEITGDIPNVSEQALSKLDRSGIVYIGAEVDAGDILVGKITPKSESAQSPEERLLKMIFGDKAADVKDSCLRLGAGLKGTVIDVRTLTRKGMRKNERATSIDEEQIEQLERNIREEWNIAERATFDVVRARLAGHKVVKAPDLRKGQIANADYLSKLQSSDLLDMRMQDNKLNEYLDGVREQLDKLRSSLQERFQDQRKKIQAGDNLAPGVLKIVKVYVAIRRNIQAGDKMAGRHGNKGVVSAIMPVEDMPFDADGVPVDLVLNPLGVPSRMNVGQILEAHLGMAGKALGERVARMLHLNSDNSELRSYLKQIYSLGRADPERCLEVERLDDQQLEQLAANLSAGVPMATPVFDGCREQEIKQMLELAGLDASGQTQLYDGRTGQAFERKVTVGYMYIIKLNHLVDDKMHARSTGSYSLVTQQPLGGKALFGGQRFGEMEVWALEAYGAAHTLQEMLTIKADDVEGRRVSYKSIIDNKFDMKAGIPESFNVLVKEIRSLALDVEFDKEKMNKS